jgi:hypothetical protein
MIFACFHVMEITWMTLFDAHDHSSQTNGQPPQRDATVAFVCAGPPRTSRIAVSVTLIG